VWNESARLVGTAVVYYNALILSEALPELQRRSELDSVEGSAARGDLAVRIHALVHGGAGGGGVAAGDGGGWVARHGRCT
jgi:hypothetical protein